MTDKRFIELLSKNLAGEIITSELDEIHGILSINPQLELEYQQLKRYFLKIDSPDNFRMDRIFDQIKLKTGLSK